MQWTLWPGVACMVTSSLLSFALQWRTALRAFGDLGAMFGGGRRRADDPIAAIETPASWFIAGQLVGLVGLAWLGHRTFGMPYWQTAVAVLLSFVLALVACRVTGETDTTPVGAMGKITQLVFGVLHPRNVSVNLMSANVTAAAASSSADLLTDLKSGYLLGAHPRKQFIAQFAGIFVGTLVTVLSFRLLVPDAGALGTDQFPAPAAQTWRAVAVALSDGLGALGPVKTWSIVIGGLAGIILTLLPRMMPERSYLVPSPAGLGLAWTFHWYYGVLFFLGGALAWWVERRYPRWSEEFTFPVASGWIAGESLMGVTIVIWGERPRAPPPPRGPDPASPGRCRRRVGGSIRRRRELGLELLLRNGADHLVLHRPVLHEQDRRDRADAVARGQRRVLVDIDLAERHLAAGRARQVLQHGPHGPARAAPLGPEVHHHHALGDGQRLIEVALVERHQPRCVIACRSAHGIDLLSPVGMRRPAGDAPGRPAEGRRLRRDGARSACRIDGKAMSRQGIASARNQRTSATSLRAFGGR